MKISSDKITQPPPGWPRHHPSPNTSLTSSSAFLKPPRERVSDFSTGFTAEEEWGWFSAGKALVSGQHLRLRLPCDLDGSSVRTSGRAITGDVRTLAKFEIPVCCGRVKYQQRKHKMNRATMTPSWKPVFPCDFQRRVLYIFHITLLNKMQWKVALLPHFVLHPVQHSGSIGKPIVRSQHP